MTDDVNKPCLQISPLLSVVDEKVWIKVKGLPPHAPITVDSYIYHHKNAFMAFGHFYSDHNGCVDVSRDVSHGGSYRGSLSMGLFTSMSVIPSKYAGGRMLIQGSAGQKLTFTISVWKGHLDWQQVVRLHSDSEFHGTGETMNHYFTNYYITKAKVERTYLAPGVKRIPIKESAPDGSPIRGVLYLPPGEGPFPGILDLFGGIGGCVEFRAALFAKHGFATMALAYFNYQDLPYQTYLDTPVSYFDGVIDWFMTRSEVDTSIGGIGMCGVSLGSQIALLTAIRNPKLKAAMLINGNNFLVADNDITGNVLLAPFLDYENQGLPFSGISDIDAQGRNRASADVECIPRMPRSTLTHTHDNPILLLVSEGEASLHGIALKDELVEQFHRSGKKGFSWMEVKAQGHLIEPPYTSAWISSPWGSSYVDGPLINELMTLWEDTHSMTLFPGGIPADHERTQEQVWNTILTFFHTHLRKSATTNIHQSKL